MPPWALLALLTGAFSPACQADVTCDEACQQAAGGTALPAGGTSTLPSGGSGVIPGAGSTAGGTTSLGGGISMQAGAGGSPPGGGGGSSNGGAASSGNGSGGNGAGGTPSSAGAGAANGGVSGSSGSGGHAGSAAMAGSGGKANTGGTSGGGSMGGGAGNGGSTSGGASGSGGGGQVDPYASARQKCVDRVNQLRATQGLGAIPRLSSAEDCADGQAKSDSESGKAHGAFNACLNEVQGWTGVAQNECPGWGSVADTLAGCIDAMWGEGPGGGHYDNMVGDYDFIACGFYTTPQGKVWMVQDFWRK